MEGSRPLLVEVQALVSQSELPSPRRVVNGIDRNRLALVLAVLGRHGGLETASSDVFLNVVGGVRVDEPGADLAIAIAVASAARGTVAGDGKVPLACFGELGLTGERAVRHHRTALGRGGQVRPDPAAGADRRGQGRSRGGDARGCASAGASGSR